MLTEPSAPCAVPVERPSPGGRAAADVSGDSGEKLLLLGLGNDILSDDAIGLDVVREVGRRLNGLERIEVKESTEMGLSLLDFVVGFQRLVVVDAVQTGRAPPGHVHELDSHSLKTLSGSAPHCFGLGEVLALGRELGLPMPDQVRVFAVEVADPFTLGTQLTPKLRAAQPLVVERVMNAVLEHGSKSLSAGSSSSSTTDTESKTRTTGRTIPEIIPSDTPLGTS